MLIGQNTVVHIGQNPVVTCEYRYCSVLVKALLCILVKALFCVLVKALLCILVKALLCILVKARLCSSWSNASFAYGIGQNAIVHIGQSHILCTQICLKAVLLAVMPGHYFAGCKHLTIKE